MKLGLSESRDKDWLLDSGFEPGEYDVICSRGKQYYNHIGNIRFRTMVESHVEEYCRAETKVGKGAVVMSIVDAIRRASPAGGFVRFSVKRGRYVEIGDELVSQDSKNPCIDEHNDSNTCEFTSNEKQAREKVGHALRERRKIGKRNYSGSPRTYHPHDLNATTLEAMDGHRSRPTKRSRSNQGDEFQHQISLLGNFTSGYAKEQADRIHSIGLQDHRFTTEHAVTQVLDMTSEYVTDDTDLPENFDIDSIF